MIPDRLDIDFGPSLGDSEIASLDAATGGSAVVPAAAPADPKDGLAYEVEKWDRYLYEQRRVAGATLDTSAGKVEAVVADHNAAKVVDEDGSEHPAQIDAERERVRDLGKSVGDALASEVFSRLYGNPEKREEGHPLAPFAPAVHEILDQLPEWEQLRASVAGDPDFAALATSDVLGPIAERLPELLKEVEQEQAEQDAQGEGNGEGEGNAPGAGAGQGTAKPKPAGPSAKDRLRAALRAGLQNSAQQTGERRETLAGIAPGMEVAPPTHEHPDATRMRLVESVAKDDRLREVLRRAGRLRRIADRRRQERRSLNAREEVVDLERGNDLARVLPAQLSGLHHPLLRKLALRGFAEKGLLQYRLEGKEPQGRGPIVVLLDRSGSMFGDPNSWASAVGVACMGIAAREHRPTTVIEFNGSVVQVTYVDAAGQAFNVDPRKTGAVTPLQGGLATAAIRVAGAGAGGGTDYDRALAVALDGLPTGLRDDRADLVFVTDGDCTIAADTLALLAKQKEKGLRMYGLTVNGGSVSAAVQAVCDNVVDIDAQKTSDRDDSIAGALPV